MKKYNVAALGELLIDFAPAGFSAQGNALHESNPGGAPANMLTSITRQGGTAAFIGKVGNDHFGTFLRGTLLQNNIDDSNLCVDMNVRTTLAFVNLSPEGDRSFSFFRSPGADTMLMPEEVNRDIIINADIFHFGSLSLTNEPARSATKHALNIAKENGVKISYDPNLRPLLWENMDKAKENIISCLSYADILKISEEEFEFLLGHRDYKRGSKEIAEKYGISHIFVTLGADGSAYRSGDNFVTAPAYDVKVVDTTGSGDAFMGAALYSLLGIKEDEFKNISEDKMQEILRYANGSGSLTATKKGGIPAIPTGEEIKELIGK